MSGAPYDVTARDLLVVRLPRLATLSLLALILSTCSLSGTASAQYCTPDQCDECNLCSCSQRCCHELPELWLVNTRCAPRCKNLDCGFERLIYKRYDRQCCRWVRESRESFLAQEATMPSLFYAHGNSLNHKNAMKGCWQIYCKMRCCAGPKRLVFWSWPAERVFKTKRLRVREMIEKNLRIKYVYAEYQGYYMAKLVDQMSLTQRVMMSGHSYGGITSSAAAHFLGGGCLRGLTLAGAAAVERPNLRAAVISGAYDHDMLNPGNRYGQAFVAAEKIYVTRNIKDRTLKKWPKTSWRCKRAIGVLGVNANCLGVYRNKLCQQTMTGDVGTSHYLKPHLNSVRFVAALCCLSFPQCNNCPAAMAETSVSEQTMAALIDGGQGDETSIDDAAVADLPVDAPADSDSIDFDFANATLTETDTSMDGEGDVFAFDNAEVESAFTEAFVDDADQLDQLTLNPALTLNDIDVEDVFGPTKTADPTPRMHSIVVKKTLADLSDSREEPIKTASKPVITTKEKTTPRQASPTQQAKPSAKPQADESASTTGQSGHRLWYQYGLCLAIVLTGQFYVLFSKRATPS